MFLQDMTLGIKIALELRMNVTISYLIPIILTGWVVISLMIMRKKRGAISYSTPKSRRLMKRIAD